MQCWCLMQLGRVEECLNLLLNETNPLLSEKIFNILIDELRNKSRPTYSFIYEWVPLNILPLAEENSQKLFSLLYTFYRRDLVPIVSSMIDLPLTETDLKGQIKTTSHLSLLFFQFLLAR